MQSAELQCGGGKRGRVKVEEGRLSDEVARTEDRNCSVSVFHTKQRIYQLNVDRRYI